MADVYLVDARRANLHGHFSRDLPPVQSIQSGDSIQFQCLDSNWGLEPYNCKNPDRREVQGRDPILDSGHALTGPIFIQGASPGSTLAVQVNALEIGAWGTTMAGGWPSVWNDRLGISQSGVFHTWTFDPSAQTAQNQHGHIVKIKPFMGIYGMPPDLPGVHSTIPPRPTGGNMDCKLLGAGSTLYLPVAVKGGLFSVGDGHAAQGNGEVSITAIECPMDKVSLTFDVLYDMPLQFPIARTANEWIALAFHENLNEAVVLALESMLLIMKREYNLSRLDAIALASVVVDFNITQAVNGVCGVHAVLPHDAITHG